MNKQAKWIWYPGDFEIYHNNLLHERREERGVNRIGYWVQPSNWMRVDFRKIYDSDKPITIHVHTLGYGAVKVDPSLEGTQYPINQDITLPAGHHELRVCISDTAKLPCIYVTGDVVSDETWESSNASIHFFPVGCTPAFTDVSATPHTFPFCYSPIEYVSREKIEGGWLYDFGRETFGPVTLKSESPGDSFIVYYGESIEETQDPDWCSIWEKLTGKTEYNMRSRAFRWIYVKGDAPHTISAQYEYLPIEDRADFECDDPLVKKIWDVCSYTFHLNSREFFLDGIKRDRWVWSGDAYQSYRINNYLFFEPEITKRTITALLGKPPYEQHINTINDYTMYAIISLYEHYFATGDTAFVKQLFPRAKGLYDFTVSRLDEQGLVVERPGDWIFMDWTPMDKEGPVCGEQILLWRASQVMAEMAPLCGLDASEYTSRAEKLYDLIQEKFWDAEKHAFIDTFASGKRNVTRHANIFAILYDFATPEQKTDILHHVLENPEITQITTPYFKFFELIALCEMGRLDAAQTMLTSYWGGMLAMGATTIWEEYFPGEGKPECFAMYSDRFGRSLCHAWGSGPIYFLGRYCLGVYPTDVAYKHFAVEPNAGLYKSFKGTVPLPAGTVHVEYDNGSLTVETDQPGGEVRWQGKTYALEPNCPLHIEA